MTELLAREKFEGHVGEVFRCEAADGAIDFELIEVAGLGPHTTRQAIEAGRRPPYSLLFRGPMEPILAQSMYRLSHAVLGQLEIFLVPVGPVGDGIGYEAVFN